MLIATERYWHSAEDPLAELSLALLGRDVAVQLLALQAVVSNALELALA